jgi:class 3 adenylate cyclase
VKSRDGVNIAYAVYGDGPGLPLVLLHTVTSSHLKLEWTQSLQSESHEIETLSAGRRLVRLDVRNSGLSDRDVENCSLEARLGDIEAVCDRVGLERFAIAAEQNASLDAVAYAGRHPEAVARLALIDPCARGASRWDTPTQRLLLAVAEHDWNLYTEIRAGVAWGWSSGEERLRMSKLMRAAMNGPDFVRMMRGDIAVDLTSMLPQIGMPTLVCMHRHPGIVSAEEVREVATLIPDAELVTVRGPVETVAAIQRFLATESITVPPGTEAAAGSAFRTILFTDIEGHTAMMQRLGDVRGRAVLREHERMTRAALAEHGGSEVKTMGDGFLASFGASTKALECAVALQKAFAAHGQAGGEPLRVRVGVNAGEPIAEDDDLFGASVIMASRIAAQAAGGQVVVSDVVRQLVAGKEFLFADRGETNLKGFETPVRTWQLRWWMDQ